MTVITRDPDAWQHRRDLAAALAGWRNPENEMATWQPTTDERCAALVEDVEWLLSTGEAPDRVARRVGRTMAAVRKAMDRAERRDLARQFDRAHRRTTQRDKEKADD